MISTDEALARILALMSPAGDVETVPLTAAMGRVLAAPARARRSQPPFAASAMDGYAARDADIRPGATLHVIGEARAGRRFGGRVGPGEAVRIFTGAPVPEGADRVLIQEDAIRDGDRVTIAADPDPQAYVRPAGLDFAAGDEISAPRRLSAPDLALIAAMNLPEVTVRRRPVVALIPTGDELAEPGETPGPDQIMCSNSYGLFAMLAAAGADPRLIPIARDDRDSLRAALEAARGADLMVTLGGVSVGDHDLVREVFGGAGLDLSFYRIAMRPGKPLMAGLLGGAPMLGLPGNPVSAMVCGRLFLIPAVDALLGLPAARPARRAAPLARALPANGAREHFARARLRRRDGRETLEVFDNQDSSVLSLLARADCLAVIPPHAGEQPAGAMVDYILL